VAVGYVLLAIGYCASAVRALAQVWLLSVFICVYLWLKPGAPHEPHATFFSVAMAGSLATFS
jgi:hypothetical protein